MTKRRSTASPKPMTPKTAGRERDRIMKELNRLGTERHALPFDTEVAHAELGQRINALAARLPELTAIIGDGDVPRTDTMYR